MRMTVLWLTAIICASFGLLGLVLAFLDRRDDG